MKPSVTRMPAIAALIAVGLVSGAVVGCKTAIDKHRDTVRNTITSAGLLHHIKVLSSDQFEGRAPGTRGEELTVSYLTREYGRIGLKPPTPLTNYIQPVPLVGITATNVRVAFNANEQPMALQFPTQAVVWTKRFVPEIKLDNSELIFVGYGIVAPEYGWDDYKDIDVRGKTIVMLVNDPPIPDPKDPSRLDERMFKGRAMTYYGRWTYKYEIAAEKGAAAALIVHETGPAGYPWAVVQGSNSRENFDLQNANQNTNRVQVEGWITLEKAKELCAAAGQDFDKLKQAATTREFKPVPLRATASISFKNAMRDVASKNVVGMMEGTDPVLKDQFLIYTAHWDHLGRDTNQQGDQIFNGARDNASGIAALLKLAELFAKTPTRRSMLFLAVTAEEKGLLGAKYYAAHPLVPLNQTIGNINMDSMNPWGRTRDVTVIGYGQTTMEDVVDDVATWQKRRIIPDAEPEKGRYFRSDHFEFAKVGVPGLYIHSGIDFVGKPREFGPAKIAAYTANDYHKVSDEVKVDWNMTGMVDDTELLYEVGTRIANERRPPEWKEGSEFRKLREPQ